MKGSRAPAVQRELFFAYRDTHVLRVITGKDGRFEAKVPAGEIEITCPGSETTKSVVTRSGETTEVELLLKE